MGDLNSLESSDTIKIAGANSSGQETNFVNSTPTGDLQTTDVMNTAATSGVLDLSTTPTPLRINAANLPNRKCVVIEGLSNSIVWGFTPTGCNFSLFKNQFVILQCGENITLYAKVTSGTGQIAVGELS